jgi:hypothetical protein
MTALKTLLTATLSSDWQVIYGSRNAVTVTKNYVAVIRGAVADDQLVTMELSRSSESYAVKVELSGSIAGAGEETMQTVITNVFTAKTAIEHAIRENATGPDLGLSAQGVLQALPRGPWEFTPASDGNVREAELNFVVAVIAQNT